MENKIDGLNIEVKRAKDLVTLKNEEIEHITAQRNQHEKEARKAKDEIEEMKTL